MPQDKADRAPDPRTPLPPRADGDKPSPRVHPAPDGRGAPPKKTPMLPWSPRRFIGILILLLALNWGLAAILAPPKKRIRVPYTPVFLDQVRAGNVSSISSEGDTVEGDFRKDVKYKKDRAKRFKTEVPTFANDSQLSKLLEEKNVTVNAKPPGDRSLLETLLISFGPTLLLVALFVFIARRATAGGGGGGRRGLGRPQAERGAGRGGRGRRGARRLRTLEGEAGRGLGAARDLRGRSRHRRGGGRAGRGG